MVKDILGSFGTFPIFDNLVSQKTASRRAKLSGLKFGPQSEYSVHTGYF